MKKNDPGKIIPTAFRTLAEHSKDLICVFDCEGNFAYVNKALADLLRSVPEEITGKNLKDIAPLVYAKKLMDLIQTVSERREIISGTFNWVFWNIEKVIEQRIIPFGNGSTACNYVLFLGMEVEAKDNDSPIAKTNFSYLLENTPNAIVVLDTQGNHLYANPQASVMTGYPHSELMNLNMGQLAVEKAIEDSKDRIRKKLEGSEITASYQTEIRKKSGDRVPVEIKSTLTDWMGEKAILVIANDISEKVFYEKSMKLQREAEEILAESDDFSAALKKLSGLLKRFDWIAGGGFYFVDKDKKKIKLVHHFNLPQAFIREVKEYSLSHPVMEMINARKSLYVPASQGVGVSQALIQRLELSIICAFPLVKGNELIGSLNLAIKGKEILDEHEKGMLESFSSKIGEMLLRVKARNELKKTIKSLEKKFIERSARLAAVYKNLLHEMGIHQQTKENLRNLETTLKEIIDNIPTGMFRTDTSNHLLEINPACVKIFEYGSHDEMIRVPVSELYFDAGERNAALKILIEMDILENYEIRLRKKNGQSFWGQIDARTIRNKEGEILFFDGTITDISQRKKIMEELEKAHKEIMMINQNLESRIKREIKRIKDQQKILIQKSKLESLGELASGIAHEVNQPLGLINMALENMYMHVVEGKATREYVKRKMDFAISQVGRIQQIIDHIRIFSRDQQSISFERVDLNQAVYSCLSFISTQYRNHGVEIRLNLNHKPLFTIGNRQKLEQVILNILSNSKFALDAKAKMQAEGTYKKLIRINSYQEGDRQCVELEDNGTGISPENLKRIFDPFFTTKEEGVGTGLGLSIVYGIIQEMKGEIQVRSREGEFTRVLLRFPSIT